MAKTIVGLFDDFSSAQQVVAELQNLGIERDNISLMANDARGEYAQALPGQTEPIDPVEDLGDGAARGAVLGGIGGLLVGLGALAIPGIGPVIAAGPIAAALAGAGAGAMIGSVLGVLVDAGVTEDQAHAFSEGVRRGGTLVIVKAADEKAQPVADVMNRFGAVDVERRAEEWRQDGSWNRFDENSQPYDADQIETERNRYRSVGTDRVGTGSASDTVYDRIDGGTERADRDSMGTDMIGTGSFSGATYQRDPVTSGESSGAADMIGGTETYHGDLSEIADEALNQTGASEQESKPEMAELRREDTNPDESTMRTQNELRTPSSDSDPIGGRQEYHSGEGQERAAMDTTQSFRGSSEFSGEERHDFESYDSDFRNHYEANFSSRGYGYDQYRPAYQYGYELNRDERYQGRDWNDIETDARTDWEHDHPGNAWEEFKDAIRQGWQGLTERR